MPSWSSEICNSNSDTSICRGFLDPPRILCPDAQRHVFAWMGIKGYKAGWATRITPFIARGCAAVWGAPQAHDLHRIAGAGIHHTHAQAGPRSGCCSARRSPARDGENRPASILSLGRRTLSTSSPIMVSRSDNRGEPAPPCRRCSFSPSRGSNFIILLTRGTLFLLRSRGRGLTTKNCHPLCPNGK